MSITAEQLDKVRCELGPLVFDFSQDSTEKTTEESVYLNHYGLDLPPELASTSHYLGCLDSRGFKLATHYWLPENPRGTYFIVHGYLEHIGLYGQLIRHLLSLDYAVVAFDLPGHGLSSGETVTIESFDHYVDVFSDLLHRCHTHFPKPWKAVGQSTGGAILLKYILAAKPEHYQNDLTSITVLAPLIHPRGWKKSQRTYQLLHRFLKKTKREFIANTANEEFNYFLANDDPLQVAYIPMEWIGSMKRWIEEFAALPLSDYPLRVIQGNCDMTVDWQHNTDELSKKFRHLKLEIVAGAQHQLVNEEKQLRDKVFDEIN
jgi:alpha-beta hydrolase superfamily lysophospholipase